MENLFFFAVFTTIMFCLLKLVEMKYLDKEFKPLKVMFRDAVIVFSSALIAAYGFFYMQGSITDFFNVVTENQMLHGDATQIFTDAPGF